MRTSEEKQEQFLEELKDLLRRYDAELVISDDGQGYGMQEGIATFTSFTNDKTGDDYCEFDLPRYLP